MFLVCLGRTFGELKKFGFGFPFVFGDFFTSMYHFGWFGLHSGYVWGMFEAHTGHVSKTLGACIGGIITCFTLSDCS